MANKQVKVTITAVDKFTGRMKKMRRGVRRFSNGIERSFNSILRLQNLIVAGAGVAVVRSLYDTRVQVDAMENKLKAATLNASQFHHSMEFVRAEADRMGVNILELGQSFGGFSASTLRMGITLKDTQEIFSNIGEAAVSLGLNTETTKRVFLALEQMASKGTVQMEELKRQLGDALPGAMQLAARSMGMELKDFMKEVSKGGVHANDMLLEFSRTVREELAGNFDEASQTLMRNVTRLGNKITKLKDDISGNLAPMANDLISSFDKGLGGNGSGLADAITTNLVRIIKVIEGFTFSIKMLVRGISITVSGLKALFNRFLYGMYGVTKQIQILIEKAKDFIPGLQGDQDAIDAYDRERVRLQKEFMDLKEEERANSEKHDAYLEGVFERWRTYERTLENLNKKTKESKKEINEEDLLATTGGSTKPAGSDSKGGKSSGKQQSYDQIIREKEKAIELQKIFNEAYELGISLPGKSANKLREEISAKQEAIEKDAELLKARKRAAQVGVEVANGSTDQIIDAIDREMRKREQQMQDWYEFGLSFGDAMASGISKGKAGLKESFKEVLKEVLRFSRKLLVAHVAQTTMEGIAKSGVTYGASLVAAAAKGAAITAAFSGLEAAINAYASGTSFSAPGMALVGERGPELVSLPTGSRVMRSPETRQSLTQNTNTFEGVTVHIHTNNVVSPEMARTTARNIEEAYRLRMIDPSRLSLA